MREQLLTLNHLSNASVGLSESMIYATKMENSGTSPLNNSVKPSAGAVLSVTDDPLMGTTVVLEHDNGYQTTYANLQAKPNVEAGDPVSAGQIIGAVGTTAAAESGQPHLHFAVTKDGKAVDPNEYLSG